MLSKFLGTSSQPNAIDTFWGWFAKNEKQYLERLKADKEQTPEVLNEILEQVQAYHPGVYGLMGFSDDDTLEFVFTVDGIVKNIVFVEDLVAKAPQFDHWIFTCLKPQYGNYDFSINYYGFDFDKHKLKFFSKIDDNYPDEINICLTHTDYHKEEDYGVLLNGALIFLDNCLGELNTACRIDYFDLYTQDNFPQEDLIPIEKLESYLVWRETEFLQKYENSSYTFPKENFVVLEGEQNDQVIVAVINQGWNSWAYKPLFSWLIKIEIKFGDSEEGMPTKEQLLEIQNLEDSIIENLDSEHVCVVGRVTTEGVSTVLIYADEYKNCSRTIYHTLLNVPETQLKFDYSLSKDKYWTAVERFL